MSENRRRVLDMLAEGKVSAEEAERLLSLLEPALSRDQDGQGARDGAPKYLRVTVDDPPETVNVRVPLALIRAGMKLSALIPSEAANGINKALEQKGIDMDVRKLKSDDLDELIDAFCELEVEVKSDSQHVHVYVE
jgi:hypothetical protein